MEAAPARLRLRIQSRRCDILAGMLLEPAVESDLPAILTLVNLAYRGPASSVRWKSEGDLIEGQRLNETTLREDLAAKPQARLLVLRDLENQSIGRSTDRSILGTVWLDPGPEPNGTWYLGLLTVRLDQQNRQLGRHLLAAAEAYAQEHGARAIRMTVLRLREPLVAWYERRGYTRTGETEPFPYGDPRLGRPLRDDLHFVVLQKTL